MKKVLTLVAAAMLAFGANAAEGENGGSEKGLSVSGAIGFSSTTNKHDGDKTQSTSSVVFAPKAIFKLNEKFGVGATIEFGSHNTKYFKNGEKDSETKSSDWMFAPVAQYEVLSLGKLSLLAEGKVFLGSSHEETAVGEDGLSVNSEQNWFNTGLTVKPLIEYKANEHISFEAGLNFFSFGAT